MKKPCSSFLMPGMVLACLSLLVTSGRAAELPANLEAAKRNYEGAISTAERDCRTRTQALNQEYAKSLDQLQDNAQANGDLDSVMATKSEKERYLKARTVTEADLSSSSAVLRSVQTQFLRASIGFEIEKNERLLGLARNHEAILAELEKELTKQGNFDEAVKVREERDLISSSPVISQIEYQLASLRVSLKRIAPETIASPAAGETPAAPREIGRAHV